MKKNQIAEGLNGLLTPAPDTTAQAPTEAAANGAITRPVTYNLNALLLEKVRYIAFYTHRKNNAIVAEALEQFVTEWEKDNGQIDVKL